MKKAILLICTLISIHSLNVEAQGNVQVIKNEKYYAIDGSEWNSVYDRDSKERLLWQEVELKLQYAMVSGRLGEDNAKEYYDTLKNLFSICKQSFESLRSHDKGKEILRNPNFKAYLEKYGVRVRNGLARNNEKFNLEEYSDCFDAVLREYTFNSDIVKDLADPHGGTYNLEFLVNDFSERMEYVVKKIETEVMSMKFKENAIAQLTGSFIASEKAANERVANSKKKRQN